MGGVTIPTSVYVIKHNTLDHCSKSFFILFWKLENIENYCPAYGRDLLFENDFQQNSISIIFHRIATKGRPRKQNINLGTSFNPYINFARLRSNPRLIKISTFLPEKRVEYCQRSYSSRPGTDQHDFMRS